MLPHYANVSNLRGVRGQCTTSRLGYTTVHANAPTNFGSSFRRAAPNAATYACWRDKSHAVAAPEASTHAGMTAGEPQQHEPPHLRC